MVLGGIYAWSTLTGYLHDEFGITNGESAFIFGSTIFLFTVVMVYSGRVLSQRGPRFTAVIGSLLFAGGYWAASFSQGSFPRLFVSISILSGVGIGFGYVVPLSVALAWFPANPALVTGLAVGGFGGGAILLSAIIEAWHASSASLSQFFRTYSLVSGLLLVLSSLLFSVPGQRHTQRVLVPKTVQRSKVMRLSGLGMFAGTFAGLLVVGNLVPLVRSGGYSQSDALASVMLFSIGNSGARILWGHLYDTVGIRSIPSSLALFVLAAVALCFPLNRILLQLAVFLLGFSFGSNFVLYAAALSHVFPVAYFSQLYPLCFLFYGLAGILAPGFGGWMADVTGSFKAALVLCIILVGSVALVLHTQRKVWTKERQADFQTMDNP
jgi:OFA family oxalate/formate antiporter-like MFS transporter